MKVISILVMAAGRSSRMGRPKLLLTYRGISLIRHAVREASQVSRDVVVVLGREPEAHRKEISDLRAKILINPDYAMGMSTSLRLGIQHLSPDSQAVIITLADQPLIGRAVFQSLMDAHVQHPDRILCAAYPELPGNPVLFPNRYYEELTKVSGDVGGRPLLQKHREAVLLVPVAQSKLDIDIDTPEDYQNLLKRKI